MPKRCARCGQLTVRRSVTPPGDWVEYLTDERDLSPPLGTLVIPLCADCYPDIADIKKRYADRDSLSETERSDLDDAVHDALDDLELNALDEDVSGG